MPLDIVELEAAISAQNEQMPFSGVILLSQNEQTILARSFGLANKAESLTNQLTTRFGMASGAKLFTAVAICQLVEKGWLSFNTRLKDCLAINFPEFDPTVTVHQLLNHTSGIPDYFDEEVMTDFAALWQARPMYEIRTPRDFLPMFQTQPMKFTPGSQWAYNNAGFIVLGLIVEQVSGLPFPHYIEANIFKPSRMEASGYFAMDKLPANTAYGYIQESTGEWKTNFYALPIIGGPDGGAFTTAADMVSFWDSLLNYRLLSQPIIDLMLTPQAQTRNTSMFYGYGVWIKQQNGVLISYHVEGEDPGVRFFSTVYPQTKIQLVVIGNTVQPTSQMQKCIRTSLELTS